MIIKLFRKAEKKCSFHGQSKCVREYKEDKEVKCEDASLLD